MKRTIRYLIVPILLLLSVETAEAAKFKKAPKNGVLDEYIVVIAEGVARKPGKGPSNLPSAAQVARLLGGLHGGQVTEVWEDALRGFVIRMPEARAKKLADDPRVLSVEQNAWYSSPIEGCYPPAGAGWPDARTPATSSPQSLTCPDPDPTHDAGGPTDPPECQDNWGLDRVDQTGWARDGSFAYVNNGTNVHVYLMDTGIQWSHREFLNSATPAVTRVSGGADARNNPVVAGTSVNTDDCYGHGTHVGAIIAGRTYGVAKNALLHPVRTRDCNDVNQSFVDRTVRALDWIVGEIQARRMEHSGVWPSVVNWSGGNDPSHPTNTALRTAVGSLVSANIPLVQAAGNGYGTHDPDPGERHRLFTTDVCLRSFGNEFPDVIVAGGMDYNDGRLAVDADFGSNAGPCVDIWAPSADIVSADMDGDTLACRLSGTSMAAPHVTGAVAAYLQSNTAATPSDIEKALRSRGTWNMLEDSPSDAHYIGYSDNVILQSNTLSIGSDTAPVASFTVTCPGRQCQVNAAGSTDDVGIVSYEWFFTDYAYITTTASGAQARYTFEPEAAGSIILKVTDGTGKTDHLRKDVLVDTNAPPVASFTSSCSGLVCSFNSTASSDDQSIASRAWTFGDGGTSSTTSPSRTYAGPGAYTVTLTVTDGAGQIDTHSETLGVDLRTPTNVVATASGPTVTISWSTALNATGYTVERKTSAAAWQPAQTVSGGSSSSTTDSPTSSSGVVLYRVLAKYSTLSSSASNNDVAYVGTFSNDPVVVLTTPLRAEHITELRTAVNGLLDIGGLSAAYTSTQLDPNNLRNEAVDEDHFVTLMQNLNIARVALSLSSITFSTPTYDSAVIATHLSSVRNGLK